MADGCDRGSGAVRVEASNAGVVLLLRSLRRLLATPSPPTTPESVWKDRRRRGKPTTAPDAAGVPVPVSASAPAAAAAMAVVAVPWFPLLWRRRGGPPWLRRRLAMVPALVLASLAPSKQVSPTGFSDDRWRRQLTSSKRSPVSLAESWCRSRIAELRSPFITYSISGAGSGLHNTDGSAHPSAVQAPATPSSTHTHPRPR